MHLTIQSILIAVGAGLSIVTVKSIIILEVVFSYVLLIVVSGLGFYLLVKMKNLVKARGEDVDYFHNTIMEYEKGLDSEDQLMTNFKIYQILNRGNTKANEYFYSKEHKDIIRGKLTSNGNGHTRRVLDKHLFSGFTLVWISFYVVSILSNISLLNYN